MTGGIFTDRPFEANPKCLVIAAIACLLYWLTACERNVFLLPVIFVVVYILIAVYDYRYNCSAKMYSGRYGIQSIADSLFKPQRTDDGDENPNLLDEKAQREHYQRTIYLFHALIIAPLLIYVGYKGVKADPRSFGALLTIGSLAFIYHSIRFFIPRDPCV
jgi:hypothetical protein